MKKYILLLLLGLTVTLNAQEEEVKLDVPLTTQEQTNWCGVAASQCVLRYFGPFVPQCNIMEYVRTVTLSYGIANCCEDVSQGCNAGIDLYGSKGSVQNILAYFGEINSNPYPGYPCISEVYAYIRENRPMIISLENRFYYTQHAAVVHGFKGTVIYYMDPALATYGGGLLKNEYGELTAGHGLAYYWFNTLVIGDVLYPQHCFNGLCNPEEGEEDIDCGGACAPCQSPPPPSNTCANCKKDPGEIEIDCGGDCPLCEDLPEEKIIKNAFYKNSTEVMATKKITTKNYVEVVTPGVEVNFITEDMGTIILLPGFKVEKGSNFSTQRRDLSEYSRICPDNLCSTARVGTLVYRNHSNSYLTLYDLLYAVKIEYEIYDEQGNLIYSDVQKITRNGKFNLWNGSAGAIIPQGEVFYWLFCTFYYCNGMKSYLMQKFVVKDYSSSKSLNEESDETENLDTPQYSNSANLNIEEDIINAPSFSILPNPNPGTFQLETNFPLSHIATLKVTGMLGNIVYETQNLTSNTIQLSTSVSGMFFVVIHLKDGTVLTQKMMVQ